MQGFGQAKQRPGTDHQRHKSHENEDEMPVAKQDHDLSQHRGEYGHDHEHHHHQRHGGRHSAAGMGVTDDGDGNDAGRGGTDALQKTGKQKKLEARRERTGDAADRVHGYAEEQRRTPAVAVGHRTEEQLGTAEADDVGEKDELHLIGVDNIAACRDVGKCRQHDVDGERIERHQRGDDGDELRAADSADGRRWADGGCRGSVHGVAVLSGPVRVKAPGDFRSCLCKGRRTTPHLPGLDRSGDQKAGRSG